MVEPERVTVVAEPRNFKLLIVVFAATVGVVVPVIATFVPLQVVVSALVL